jgi:TPR repeat protein
VCFCNRKGKLKKQCIGFAWHPTIIIQRHSFHWQRCSRLRRGHWECCRSDAGNARAQYNYALLLEEAGTDRVAVEKYYKMASDEGLLNAMCNYASFLSATDAAMSV